MDLSNFHGDYSYLSISAVPILSHVGELRVLMMISEFLCHYINVTSGKYVMLQHVNKYSFLPNKIRLTRSPSFLYICE